MHISAGMSINIEKRKLLKKIVRDMEKNITGVCRPQ